MHKNSIAFFLILNISPKSKKRFFFYKKESIYKEEKLLYSNA